MKPAICLEWRSRLMPVPAYWYYPPEDQARVNADLHALHARGIPLVVRVCEVPSLAPLIGKPAPWREGGGGVHG